MKKNEVQITKTINDCKDCPEFFYRDNSDPFDLDDFTPPTIKCKESGEKLMQEGYFVSTYPIPNSCPKLKKQEKEREL